MSGFRDWNDDTKRQLETGGDSLSEVFVSRRTR